MTPVDFWLKAAEWGSYMHTGDPGSCMYGFDERGAVQSEEHRAASIEWLDKRCRSAVAFDQFPALRDEAFKEIDELIDYLRTAPNLNPPKLEWVERRK